MHQLLARGRKDVDCFERAVSGRNGHATAFLSARKIARFVNFDRDLAWELLLHYNATKCDPPWGLTRPDEERALRHKLEEGLRKG